MEFECGDTELLELNSNACLKGALTERLTRIEVDDELRAKDQNQPDRHGTFRKFFKASSTEEVGGSPKSVAATFLSIHDSWATCRSKVPPRWCREDRNQTHEFNMDPIGFRFHLDEICFNAEHCLRSKSSGQNVQINIYNENKQKQNNSNG